MAGKILPGRYKNWNLSRDDVGHRTYKITHCVKALVDDGPQVVLNTPGLPQIGDFWSFDNDLDFAAFCTPNIKITPQTPNEPNEIWFVENTFTTRDSQRCQDQSIENPLLEPPRISGGSIKYTKPARRDRFGKLIKSSSNEFLKGSELEFDDNRPQVKIGLNLAFLNLGLLADFMDKLNDRPLWELGPRKVKLSAAPWSRNYFGLCFLYYSIDMTFDINFDTFDIKIPDHGNVCLIQATPPLDPKNLNNYEVCKDIHGENRQDVLLDGAGNRLTDADNPFLIEVEHYEERNLFLLGIPPILT